MSSYQPDVDNLLNFIDATLNSVLIPSGQPDVARAFREVNGAIKHFSSSRPKTSPDDLLQRWLDATFVDATWGDIPELFEETRTYLAARRT